MITTHFNPAAVEMPCFIIHLSKDKVRLYKSDDADSQSKTSELNDLLTLEAKSLSFEK